ncbi:MAG: ABC transporter permease [Acidimicrobiia bacterium]
MSRARPPAVAFGALGAAARSSLIDYAVIFTWRSWLLGWLMRVMSQTVFYGLLGKLLGSTERQRYLFVGAAVLVCGAEALLVCASTVNERRVGALSLIVASPSDAFLVLLGRGVLWIPGGVATSAVCLFVLGPLFGVTWTFPAVVAVLPLIILTSVSTYCLGIALGALVLARPELRNVVGTVAATGLAVVCGVTVPLGQWPLAVRAIGTCVPLTYTLAAVRASIDGERARDVLLFAAQAAAWGTVWLGVAWLGLHRLVAAGRRTGSIDLGG